MTMRVNATRLRADLEHLATFGGRGDGSVNRPAYSSADVAARHWFAEQARAAGLQVRTDPLLNVIIGPDSPGPAVWTGSHLDTVPDGGMFDGALGAVAALECLRRLHEEEADLRVPVRGVAFADEEGSYLGFLGAKALVHGLDHLPNLDADTVARYRGADGRTLAEAVADAGGELAEAGAAGLGSGAVERFVELHIEQGPHLEVNGTNIGVVTHIVGVGRLQLHFEGRPDHAGTTPMYLRRDALRAAAGFIDSVPEIPARCGHADAVVTCGDVDVRPGAPNVVPYIATVHVDYRADTMAALERLHEALVRSAYAAGARHGVRLDPVVESITPPVQLDPESADLIGQNSTRLGLSHVDMPSRAGHDAQVMAEVAPTGMIFVPSRDGRSHSRLEHTSWDDVTNGAEVLLNTLLTLAGKPG